MSKMKISDYNITKIIGNYAITVKDDLYGLSLLTSKSLQASVILEPEYDEIKIVDKLVIVKKGHDYGLFDIEGNCLLDTKYSSYKDNKNGTFTFIKYDELLVNSKGNIIFEFNTICGFEGDYAQVSFVMKDMFMVGVIDKLGNIVFQEKWNDHKIKILKDGYFIIKSQQIKPKSQKVKNEIKGFMAYMVFNQDINSYWEAYYLSKIVDKYGQEIIPYKYEDIEPIGNNRLLVTLNKNKKIIDYQDNVIAKISSNYSLSYQNEYDVLQYSNRKCLKGLMNNNGEKLTKLIYERISPFYDGIAHYEQKNDCKEGFIDTQGHELFASHSFSCIKHLDGPLFIERKGVFNVKTGAYIINNSDYSAIKCNGFNIVITDNKGMKKLYTLEGKIIDDKCYNQVDNYHNGVAKVRYNQKFGLIYQNGKQLFKLINFDFSDYEIKDDLIVLKHNNNKYSLFKNGKPLIIYEECKTLTILNDDNVIINNYVVPINEVNTLNMSNNNSNDNVQEILNNSTKDELKQYLNMIVENIGSAKAEEIIHPNKEYKKRMER